MLLRQWLGWCLLQVSATRNEGTNFAVRGKDETTKPVGNTLVYPYLHMLTCNAPIPAFPRVHMDGAAASALANARL